MSQCKPATVARQEFYCVNDVAEIMGASRETARKQMLVWQREGKVVTFGKRLFIRREIFDDWTAQQDGFDKITGQRNFKLIRGKRKN